MNYNEWRDELKSNLISVSDAEKRRVLAYYAEAYADRREAGFSEEEIINGFGAPYDAAQKILADKVEDTLPQDTADTPQKPTEKAETPKTAETPKNADPNETSGTNEKKTKASAKSQNTPPPAPIGGAQQNPNAQPVPKGNKFAFAVLCIVLFIMFGGFIIGFLGLLIGLCAAPIGAIASGITSTVFAVRSIIYGYTAYGLCDLGASLMLVGVGVILCPLCFKLIKIVIKLFKKGFNKFKSLFYEGGRK